MPRHVPARTAVVLALATALGLPLGVPAVAAEPNAAVVINEIESDSAVTADYVELINRSSAPADLSGWQLTDDKALTEGKQLTLPAGTVLQPGQILLLEQDAPGSFGFGLGKADTVTLLDAAGTPVDSYGWDGHALTTYGRYPDGTGPFVTTSRPTPGAPNQWRAPVVLNEVESDPATGQDWVELLNVGDAPVDLTGFTLTDADPAHVYRFPDGTTLAPGARLVVERTDDPASGLTFSLGSVDAVTLRDGDGAEVDSTAWTSHASVTWGRCVDGTGPWADTAAATPGAVNACRAASGADAVVVNEASSQGVPEDFIELYNAGATAVDLSGWIIVDDKGINDPGATTLPQGTVIQPGQHLLLQSGVNFPFGLGKGDHASLYDPSGQLVSQLIWPVDTHADPSWGYATDATGDPAMLPYATPGAANDSPAPDLPAPDPTVPETVLPWPGPDGVRTVDPEALFTADGSGLDVDPATGTLWAVENGKGLLFGLTRQADGTWTDTTHPTGRVLTFAGGIGTPDAEAVSVGPDGRVYVGTERDNAGVVRRGSYLAVLAYDPRQPGGTLIAQDTWVLNDILPTVGSNAGIEGLEFVPDAVVAGRLVRDDGSTYEPASMPAHGSGVWFVALEGTGDVYAVTLNTDGSATLLATISPTLAGVMALDYDTTDHVLWMVCDNLCGTTAARLSLAPGTFGTIEYVAPPAGMGAGVQNEGFATLPATTGATQRPVFWISDGDNDGFSVREGALTVPVVEVPPTPAPQQPTRPGRDTAPGHHGQPGVRGKENAPGQKKKAKGGHPGNSAFGHAQGRGPQR